MGMSPRLLRPVSSGPSDPYFPSVTLLLHFDSSFSDSSGANVAVTATGNASISTAQKKFGAGSAYFDGDADYLVIAADSVSQLGAGDFTVEFWCYPITLNTYTVLTGNFTVINNGQWQLLMNGSGGLSLFVAGFASFSVPLATGSWQHVALVRKQGDMTLYLNGVSGGTEANATDLNSAADLWIGRAPENEVTRWFNGYIDEYRITKGVARYSSNFTPPSAAFLNQ